MTIKMHDCRQTCSDPCEGPNLRCDNEKAIEGEKSMNENETSLQEQLMRIGRLLRRYIGKRSYFRNPEANPYQGQGRVLRLLQMKPEISQKELSYLLDMRPQSLGELLMKLERSGYITRTTSEDDKRVMNICLTEEGRDAADHVEEQAGSTELFDFLSEEDRSVLSDILDRIASELEKQIGEDHDDNKHNRGHEREQDSEHQGRKHEEREDNERGHKHDGGNKHGGHRDDDRHGGHRDDDKHHKHENN